MLCLPERKQKQTRRSAPAGLSWCGGRPGILMADGETRSRESLQRSFNQGLFASLDLFFPPHSARESCGKTGLMIVTANGRTRTYARRELTGLGCHGNREETKRDHYNYRKMPNNKENTKKL